MQTLSITSYQVLYSIQQTSKTMDVLSQQLSTGKKINAPKSDPAKWVTIQKNRSESNVIQAVNDTLNSVAQSIRVADKAMETIGKNLEQMKELLERIIKNYPPFPEGSEERVKFLKSYTAMRYLIDKLTIPPENKGAAKIMADPSVLQEAGDWEILLGENGITKTIHNQEVHTGSTGLDIPDLPENATDEEIYKALEKLDQAEQTLIIRRESLAIEATMIPAQKDFNEGFSKLYEGYAEELETTDVVEVAIEMNSIELRQALSYESIGSLTKARTYLMQLWK